MGVFLSTARSNERQLLDYVRVQPRVAHGVMIDKNLKAKELYTVGTKEVLYVNAKTLVAEPQGPGLSEYVRVVS